MAHVFDQDDTKIDQACQILNKPGHIKHSRWRVVQTQRIYEWQNEMHLQNNTQLAIPQSVTLSYF